MEHKQEEKQTCQCKGSRTCGICEKDKMNAHCKEGVGTEYSIKPKGTVYDVVNQGKDEKLSSCAFPDPSSFAPGLVSDERGGGPLLRLAHCGSCGNLFRLRCEDTQQALLPVIARCSQHSQYTPNTTTPTNTSSSRIDTNNKTSVVSEYLPTNTGAESESSSVDGGEVWIPGPSDVKMPEGLSITPDFITEFEEANILKALDTEPQVGGRGWKESQSGRRKQDFGPQANFKKRKIKLGPLDDPWVGVHPEYACLQNKIPLLACIKGQPPFQVAQWSALDYTPNTGSNLDPHVDDAWMWGERILGVSMVSSCIMSFLTSTSREGPVIEIQVVLPQRSLFAMQGPSRHTWLHGIRTGSVTTRRISITIREIESHFAAQHPDLTADVVARVNTLRTLE